MGIFDKLTAKMAAMGPDHSASITAALGPDDVFVACGMVTAAAYERGGGVGGDAATRLLRVAVNKASNAVAGERHVGGEPGTIGQSLPRDSDRTYGAISAKGFSLWSFGQFGTDPEPTLVLRVNGDDVRTVTDTGQKAQGGQRVLRFAFTDGSFFDYRVLGSDTAFIDGLLQRWPA